jgi:hypothetical protein
MSTPLRINRDRTSSRRKVDAGLPSASCDLALR